MSEAKRGPLINYNTRLSFIREDKVELPVLADNGFGDNWSLAAAFLTEFAENQINSYPHYDSGQAEWTKTRILEELRESHPVDSVPYLIAMEPIALLTNLDDNQLLLVLQGVQHLGIAMDCRDKTIRAESVIQGILLGRLTAK